MRQVPEVDPPLCPHCAKTMRVVAAIDRSAVIRQVRSAEFATKPRRPAEGVSNILSRWCEP